MATAYLRQLIHAVHAQRLDTVVALTAIEGHPSRRVMDHHLPELVEEAARTGHLAIVQHLVHLASPRAQGALLMAAWTMGSLAQHADLATAVRRQLGPTLFDQDISGRGWQAVAATMDEGWLPTAAQASVLLSRMNNPFRSVDLNDEQQQAVYDRLAGQIEIHTVASLTLAMERGDDPRVMAALSQMAGDPYLCGGTLLAHAARQGRLTWIQALVAEGAPSMYDWASALKESIEAKQDALLNEVFDTFPEVLEGLARPLTGAPNSPIRVVLSALVERAGSTPSPGADWEQAFDRVRLLHPIEVLYAASMEVLHSDFGWEGTHQVVSRLPRAERALWLHGCPRDFIHRLAQTEAEERAARTLEAGQPIVRRKPRVRA